MEFYELQRFRQWWLWLIVIFSVTLPLTIAIIEYALQRPLSEHVASSSEVLIYAIFGLTGILLFSSIRLETKINASGIHYRFFPFQLSYRTILWEEVDQAYVREYSPIKEYGGWGVRYGVFGKTGSAYNISGNRGIQILLKSGRKLLIGTQKPHEVQTLLDRLHHKRPLSTAKTGIH